uniref:Uncharacterized protein n=1 Tax=Parastrongyloides trichosuri TaxID=131310 RepID=A0A0N4ZKI9_PARTI
MKLKTGIIRFLLLFYNNVLFNICPSFIHVLQCLSMIMKRESP